MNNAVDTFRHRVLIDRTTRAVMRDGVELAMVIVRPDTPGRFPAVMSYNPYRTLTAVKPDYSETEYNHRWDGPSYFAERGYAVIYFDVRGTGNSGGSTQHIYSEEEQRDAYEMVEWIARQSWCDGNVGMWGMSYGGVVQWQVGVQSPPHLKTLVVGSSNDSVYLDWTYPGGSLRPYMFDAFSPLMTANNFAPPDPEIVGEKWGEIWQARLEENIPWGAGFLSHALDDDYWTAQSLQPDYSRIKVPVMLWSGWADCYPTPILRAFSKIDVPKKVFIGPWGHFWPEEALPGPRIDFRHELLKWFDHWLKGKDTGVMQEPPVTLFVRSYKEPQPMMPIDDNGAWRAEMEWPLSRTRSVPLYFGSDGRLDDEPESEQAHDAYEYDPTVGVTAGIYWGGGIVPWAMPLDQRGDETKALTFTTAPLTQDTELTGEPQAVLYISSSAETGYFHVKITDVAPDGTSKWVTDGGLLTSHRSSHTLPEPMVPGEIYELKIDLKFMAYVFRTGHRIRVAIASSDLQNAWPAGRPAVHTLYRGGRHASHVMIPIVPAQNPRLSRPDLKPSPRPAPDPDDYRGSQHKITDDLVNDTLTVELERVSGLLPNSSSSRPAFGQSVSRREARSLYTVSRRHPADASLRADHTYTIERPEGEIKVEANELLVSDEHCFRFTSRLEIKVDGKSHCLKSWSISRPRQLD